MRNFFGNRYSLAINAVALVICVLAIFYFFGRVFDSKAEILHYTANYFQNPWFVAAQIGLFCLNFFVETVRWRYINGKIEPVSMAKALKTVFVACAFAQATIANVGEHVARVGESRQKKGTLAASIVASFSQTAVIFFFGAVAVLLHDAYDNRIIWAFAGAILLAAAVFFFVRKKITGQIADTLRAYRAKEICVILMLYSVRYAIFSLQLYLFLMAEIRFGSFEILGLIPIYYFFITFIPSSNLLTIGIKGSIAMWIFSSALPAEKISAAVLGIWYLNSLLPSIIGIGIFLIKKFTQIKSSLIK